jgi:hypothetical protein
MASKNRLYPHLLPVDIEVWERWLTKNGADFLSFDYDVRVGDGRDPGESYSPNIRQMGIDLSQRRIDAVGHQPGQITIIEITRSAGLKTIGQTMAYPVLYRRKFNYDGPLQSIIVCESVQDDMTAVLNAHNIETQIV